MVKTLPSNAGGAGPVPGGGAGIPHASLMENQTKKRKRHGNKFSKKKHENTFNN